VVQGAEATGAHGLRPLENRLARVAQQPPAAIAVGSTPPLAPARLAWQSHRGQALGGTGDAEGKMCFIFPMRCLHPGKRQRQGLLARECFQTETYEHDERAQAWSSPMESPGRL
jgi:hypothetical protein